MRTDSRTRAATITAMVFACWLATRSATARGVLELSVVDAETKQPIACRIHLKNARGRPRFVARQPKWADHFVFDGQLTLKLPNGDYTFELEHGPEYVNVTGHFTINEDAYDSKTVALKRIVDMKSEGWWSGELHVHRKLEEIELLMRAEDLHVAPVITWWNKRNLWAGRAEPQQLVRQFDGDRFYHVMAGEDERGGGALLYFNLPRPLPITAAEREFPSAMTYLVAARRHKGLHVDIEKPFWWDVPIWLASGKVDSIGLANNHMYRGGMYPKGEAWGRPRDTRRLPAPWGNGQWSQEIYYHVLNAGLRIPPSAGSASGVLPNPLGYNRMYAFVGEDLTYEKWFDAVKRGRVLVTNGPLLRATAQGRLPGHVFTSPDGGPLDLRINASLATRDPIDYLEIIKNGEVAHVERVRTFAGKLPQLHFDESGWFLIRVVTSVPQTYRFATTGPFYVQIGEEPRRISRTSVQFFLDWLDKRAEMLNLPDDAQRGEVIGFLKEARAFWQSQLAQANAE